jgi:hypothetical protein
LPFSAVGNADEHNHQLPEGVHDLTLEGERSEDVVRKARETEPEMTAIGRPCALAVSRLVAIYDSERSDRKDASMFVSPLAQARATAAAAQTPPSTPPSDPAPAPLTGDRIERSTQPNAAPVKHGFGIGLIGSATAEGGLGAGAGATAAAGAGLFYDGGRSVHPGAYAGAGAFAGGGEQAAKAPHTADAVGVLGVFAGIGVGIFVTNAASAEQLGGPAQTYSCNVGIGPVKLSVQLGISDSTYAGAVSVGPGIGLDVSRYPTQTVTTPR